MNKYTNALILSAFLVIAVSCSPKENPSASNAAAYGESLTPTPVSAADRSQALADLPNARQLFFEARNPDELGVARQHLSAIESILIAPTLEDIQKYAEFLKDPTTGLIRIYPRSFADERRPFLICERGAFYQFKNRSNAYGQGSDLEYDVSRTGHFNVGFAGVDFGFIAPLGEVDINAIDLHNASIEFAMNYVPPNGQLEPAWRSEQRKWQQGLTSNGLLINQSTEAAVGSTYVLRSVREGRSDMVVAFQVVRKDDGDDSLILAWKILKEFQPPTMKRL